MIELYKKGSITEESALLYCTSKGVTSRGIDEVKKERGEETSGVLPLKMDTEYGNKTI